MASKDGRYRLPEVIDPERICIQLYVPNDFNHLLAFWAQLEGLGSALNWGNDEAHTALQVAAVWREVYEDARERYFEGGCGMDDPCCPDSIEQQIKTNLLLDKMISLIGDGFKIVPLSDGIIPDEVATGACVPDHFDTDDDDTGGDVAQRELALCYTVNAYVKSIIFAAGIELGISSEIMNALYTDYASFPASLRKLKVVYPAILITIAILEDIFSTLETVEIVTCQMLASLAGKANRCSNFQTSVSDSYLPLQSMVRSSNQNKQNWVLFNEALGTAFEMDLSEFTCPCVDDAEDACGETPIDIVLYEYDSYTDGQIITNLGGNRWRFQNSNISTPPGGRSTIRFKDSLDRCLLVEADAEGQPVFFYSIGGCLDGDGDCLSASIEGYGGFAPIHGKVITFQTIGATDTVYKVTCCVPTP